MSGYGFLKAPRRWGSPLRLFTHMHPTYPMFYLLCLFGSKNSHFLCLSSWPFASLGCSAWCTLSLLLSGNEGYTHLSAPFQHSAGCTVRTQQVKKGDSRAHSFFPEPFFLLSACLFHSLHRIPPAEYRRLLKDTILLKRKGIDVRSKLKELNGIWENKPKTSNCVF